MSNRKWAETQLAHRKEELLKALNKVIIDYLDVRCMKPELCEMLGVSRATLDRIVRKDPTVSLDTLYIAAMGFNMDVAVLIRPTY